MVSTFRILKLGALEMLLAVWTLEVSVSVFYSITLLTRLLKLLTKETSTKLSLKIKCVQKQLPDCRAHLLSWWLGNPDLLAGSPSPLSNPF